MEQRNVSFDIVAGICIVFMIFTHICQLSYNTGWPVYKYSLGIFSYYMFFFFMKSGCFDKPTSWRECLKKNWRKLIIPFAIYSIIGHFVYCCLLCQEGNLTFSEILIEPLRQIYYWGASMGNLPLWFLICLFSVKVIYCMLDNLHVKSWMVFIASFMVAVGLQIAQMTVCGHAVPYSLGAIAMALSIYSFAVFMRNKPIRGGQYATWLLGVVYVVSIFLHSPGVDIRSNASSGFCLPWFLFCFLSCTFLLKLFSIEKFQVKLLANIGKHSMTYYVWHWIILNLTTIVYHAFGGQSNKVLLVVMVFVYICVLPGIQVAKDKILKFKSNVTR